jgi:hypothetical protein
MVIKGVKHLAEVTKLQDLKLRHQMFRYSVQREGTGHIIYWGHEASEEAAIQMAKKYLDLMDQSAEAASIKSRPRSEPLGLNPTESAAKA